MIVIEKKPLAPEPEKGVIRQEVVKALYEMQPGESFFAPLNYYRAKAAISQSQRRKTRLRPKLDGVFRVVPEQGGVRIGRIE